MSKKASIFKHIDKVVQVLPAPIYLEDINSVIIGCNESVLKASGALVKEAYVGKSLYEIYPNEMAEHIKLHNEEVMRTGEISSQEETIKDITTGEIKHFKAVKGPLRDDEGNIIGIIGTSIDITAEKEAEKLKQNLIEQKEKFIKIVNQVAHDIRSPLASLLMIVKSCTEIPEEDRIALREAAISIGDIANHLLNQYQKNDAGAASELEERQPVLVSAVLLQLLTDKKYQYQDLPIRFHCDFSQKANFAFISVEPSSFKRMISNLINNSVDALSHQGGKVELHLEASNEWMKIIIRDNGKGMPQELIDKILQNIPFTDGKEDGHGIGFTQVHETLQRNNGELAIDSQLNQGTTITLTFPRIKAPKWLAEEIVLDKSDTIVILDDDNSIHGAWRAHFDPMLKKSSDLSLKHFTKGHEAVSFLNGLSAHDKRKVFLLTDYELLKQELNGLDVVAKTQVERSILVTSHYANPKVQEQAAKTGTKILPKQLASEIPIMIDESLQYNIDDKYQKADLIIVDDNERFIRNLVLFAFADKNVDEYYDPHHFLNNIANYPKDIKIYLDNNFAASEMKGMDIAKQLYDLGYHKLYLLSGDDLAKEAVPAFLTVIRKDDIEGIRSL